MTGVALLFVLAATTAKPTPTVTLDVKDADVRVVLKSMQKQCGIKNLVIDPDVKGTGATLKFREVPCPTAFKIVLRQFNLAAQPDLTLTQVETRKP